MITAFKERKPWASSIVALLLGPYIGAAYLNRGRLAFVYLFLIIIFFPFNPFGLLPFAVQIGGTLHCFLIAKRRNYSPQLRWYSHWYILIISFIVMSYLILQVAKIIDPCYFEPWGCLCD